ncbi:MAG TPA: TIGR04282 family arsenosugar biosynthesis glycosyltransferase [Myxococcota bacterium]|nr:TIGR04282 family arsenosugar biosynthesis glycosyltransferase [Myxococcota bacterium]
MSGALVVFAKEPRPGAVKTRLCPPFAPDEAAALYACMLDDVLEASAAAAAELGLAPFLYATPADACERLARRTPPGFRVRPQRGPDLGARMEHAAAELAAEGFAPLLLRGSDSPVLASDELRAALAALAEADLALSPDPDGGYNLVALRTAVPGLFDHPMSTERVLDDTLSHARARGLRSALLAPGFDVDVAEDLALLARARREGRAATCPRTLAWLDARGSWPGAGAG